MNKKISLLVLFFLVCTYCGDSPNSGQGNPLPEPEGQSTSESFTYYKIVLDADLDEDITIDYSPLYADNILYSTELSRKGNCLEIRSDYLNAVVISYDRKELCDNVDAIQKEYCGSGDITILSDSKGVYIDNEASTASYDNCDSFVTGELERRLEELRSCIGELNKYDSDKAPLRQEEDIRRRKECVEEARNN